MNYKKSILFSFLVSFFLINSFFVKAEEATSWFSMPEWLSNTFSAPKNVNYGEIRDKAALYLGYVAILFLLEQGFECCVHLYNKSYGDHADAFRKAILKSELMKKNFELNNAQHLRNLAAEFRNPLYRYTIGLIKKNQIEDWLEAEIQRKKWDKDHTINKAALNQLLCEGSY